MSKLSSMMTRRLGGVSIHVVRDCGKLALEQPHAEIVKRGHGPANGEVEWAKSSSLRMKLNHPIGEL